MYRAPALLCQRHHRRTLHARKHLDNFFQTFLRCIHQHIFLIFRRLHSIHTEKQLFQDFLFLVTQIPVTNQQCFRFHHHFHLSQPVTHQRRTRTNNIKNRICQSDARCHFYGTCNHMYLRIHILSFQECTEDTRIRRRNLPPFKPLHTRIFDILRNSQ